MESDVLGEEMVCRHFVCSGGTNAAAGNVGIDSQYMEAMMKEFMMWIVFIPRFTVCRGLMARGVDSVDLDAMAA